MDHGIHPGPQVRSRLGVGTTPRPPGHRLVDSRAHATQRRNGHDHVHGGGRHRGRVGTEARMTTRVFLVDDHRLFLSGVQAELAARINVVGTAIEVNEAINAIRDTQPDVVLVVVHLPGGGGKAIIESVLRTHPDTRFLALSVSDAAEDVIAVIRAGARGYVTKSIGPDELADAVRRVHEGDAVFSPRLAGFVLDAFAGEAPAPESDTSLDQLTPREREVLQHIARGYMYKEIARRLSISTKTVEAPVSAVLRKLQLSSRHELSRWAAERRLL